MFCGFKYVEDEADRPYEVEKREEGVTNPVHHGPDHQGEKGRQPREEQRQR